MRDNVVRFPVQKVKPPSSEELVERIRILAAPNAARYSVRWKSPQFQQQLLKVGLSMRQVLETVRKGCALGTPQMEETGGCRLKIKRKVAGRRTVVDVTVKEDHIVLETAI
jgi:hypothetical protein